MSGRIGSHGERGGAGNVQGLMDAPGNAPLTGRLA